MGEAGQSINNLGVKKGLWRRLVRILGWVALLIALVAAVVVVVAVGPSNVVSRVSSLAQGIGSGPKSGQAASGSTDCVRCHSYPIPEAIVWVAVNGNEVPKGKGVEVLPGDSFEVDFHFTNVLGNPEKFMGVGIQVVVPAKPLWRVSVGTYNYPKAWSPQGNGASFWSPKWDRSTNGDTAGYAKWNASPEVPGGYYLLLSGTPFGLPAEVSHGAVEADRGRADPSDRDGVANHAGGDMLISVPADTPPGEHKVTVYGIGHDSKNRLAHAALSFTVTVAGAKKDGQSGLLGQVAGNAVYTRNCAGCHGTTPNIQLLDDIKEKSVEDLLAFVAKGSQKMPAQSATAGGRLSDEEIAAAVEYVQAAAKRGSRKSGPMLQHGLVGREGVCLECHKRGGEAKPPPEGHVYTAQSCLTCHPVPPRMPHSAEGHAACSSCHKIPESKAP